MLHPLAQSIIRTGVPALVSALCGLLLVWLELDVPDEVRTELVLALSLVAGQLYYLAARLLERRVPRLSWLLGTGAHPVAYATPTAAGDRVVTVAELDPHTVERLRRPGGAR